MFKKILEKLAVLQVRHPYFVITLIILLSLIMYSFSSNVRTVAALENMLPYDLEEVKAFNILRDNNLGQDGIAIVVELSKDEFGYEQESLVNFNDTTKNKELKSEFHNYLKELDKTISNNPGVLDVISVTDYLDKGLTFKDSYIHGFFNDDYSKTMLFIKTDVSANDLAMNSLSNEIKNDLEGLGTPSGVKLSITGTPIIQQKLGELVNKDRKNTQWISTLLVYIITALVFSSFIAAIIPILIVSIAVNWLYGTMGYYDLPTSTLAGGVASMVIGIGIAYSLYLMNKFKFNRKKGLSIEEAMKTSVISAGTSLTASSMTTIAAFLAFMVGDMPEMGRFGLLMMIGVSYSFLFSIIGLPSLLVIEEQIYELIANKWRFGLEKEYELKKDKFERKSEKYKHHSDDNVFWGDEI